MVSDIEIRKLTYEIREDLFNPSSSVSSIVRKYYTLLQYLNEEDEIIKGELFGFKLDKTPKYRLKLFRGSPVAGTNNIQYQVRESIALIENSKNIGRKTTLTNQLTYMPRTITITPMDMHHIIESVKNHILISNNKKIIQMEYSEINYQIFEETKKYVDQKLLELDSSIMKNLVENYDKLKLVNDTNTASQIAFSCRQILEDFTESIFNEEYLPEGSKRPDKKQTKNKVRYVLSSIESETNRKMIETQIDYFSEFTDFINKNVHPENFKLYREDANRSIIYTYLIIGDIIKLIETK